MKGALATVEINFVPSEGGTDRHHKRGLRYAHHENPNNETSYYSRALSPKKFPCFQFPFFIGLDSSYWKDGIARSNHPGSRGFPFSSSFC